LKKEDKKEEQEPRTYPYNKCPACQVKVHVYARTCQKCGQKIEMMIYRSNNKDDAIYSMDLNSVEKCMSCFNVLQRRIACETIICFGTGRGSCEYCRRTAGTRFECCQREQKDYPKQSLSEALKEIIRNSGKTPGPMAEVLTEAIEKPQYDDVIPF